MNRYNGHPDSDEPVICIAVAKDSLPPLNHVFHQFVFLEKPVHLRQYFLIARQDFFSHV